MLDQIVYLRYEALIGNANFMAGELVDVGCPRRAAKLQDDGAAFLVADAVAYSNYIDEVGDDDGAMMEVLQFLNRVRSFPLEWRTPEWEKLVARMDALEGIPVNINVSVNNQAVN